MELEPGICQQSRVPRSESCAGQPRFLQFDVLVLAILISSYSCKNTLMWPNGVFLRAIICTSSSMSLRALQKGNDVRSSITFPLSQPNGVILRLITSGYGIKRKAPKPIPGQGPPQSKLILFCKGSCCFSSNMKNVQFRHHPYALEVRAESRLDRDHKDSLSK